MVSSLHCLRNKTGLTIDVYALCALYLRCLTETAWQLEPCLGALHDVLRNHGDLALDRGKARRLAPWQNSKQQGLDSSHNRTKENNETTKIPALSKFRGHLQEKAFKGSLLSARNIPKRNHFDVNEKQRQVRKYLREEIHWKKNVFFRALPILPNPPPLTPISATWSSFFGRQNSRFESQFRT